MFQPKRFTMWDRLMYQHGVLYVIVVGVLAGCGTKSAAPTSNATPGGAAPSKPQAADAPPPVGPQLVLPKTDASEAPTDKKEKETSGPQSHTTFYRADTAPAAIPKVAFTKRENALCKIEVGGTMPAIALPLITGSGTAKLTDLFGKKATVVVFWKSDRRMTLEELSDLEPDVVAPFGKDGVAVLGIAVKESAASAADVLKKADAKFINLLDADGKAFAQVGSERLPRTYVLDPSGKILWFDIEYSHATRRELHDVLRAVTGQK